MSETPNEGAGGVSVEGQDERAKAEAERVFGTGEWDKPLRNAFLAGARFAAQRVERTVESQDERRAKIEAALETVKFSSNVLDYYEAVWTAALVESEAREQEWREKAAEDNAAIVADTKEILALRAREAVLVEARDKALSIVRAARSGAEGTGRRGTVQLMNEIEAALAPTDERSTDGREANLRT